MTDASRRVFLAATGTTAAAAAALAASPAAYASSPRDAALSDAASSGERQPDLVAYVQDSSSGDLTLLVGEHEVVAHDPALVRSLLRAARR
jgi:hypothetical protein